EGNGCAERMIRTLKEQLLWVRTFETVEELRQALLAWQKVYNEHWMVAGTATAARHRCAGITTPRCSAWRRELRPQACPGNRERFNADRLTCRIRRCQADCRPHRSAFPSCFSPFGCPSTPSRAHQRGEISPREHFCKLAPVLLRRHHRAGVTQIKTCRFLRSEEHTSELQSR